MRPILPLLALALLAPLALPAGDASGHDAPTGHFASAEGLAKVKAHLDNHCAGPATLTVEIHPRIPVPGGPETRVVTGENVMVPDPCIMICFIPCGFTWTFVGDAGDVLLQGAGWFGGTLDVDGAPSVRGWQLSGPFQEGAIHFGDSSGAPIA